jgi:hypothetical protein
MIRTTSQHHGTHLALQEGSLRHNGSQLTQKRQREGTPLPPSRGANLYLIVNCVFVHVYWSFECRIHVMPFHVT